VLSVQEARTGSVSVIANASISFFCVWTESSGKFIVVLEKPFLSKMVSNSSCTKRTKWN